MEQALRREEQELTEKEAEVEAEAEQALRREEQELTETEAEQELPQAEVEALLQDQERLRR